MKNNSFVPPFAAAIPLRWLILAAALAILLIFGVSLSRAELATSQEMAQAAENWITYIVNETGNWAGDANPSITDVQDLIVDDTLLARYYAVSSGGYVIVPVLKELPPVKAYSETSSLDIYEADGFALMLRQVLQHRTRFYGEIYGDLNASQPPDEPPLYDFKNRHKWDDLTVSSKEFSASAKSLMEPLEGAGPLLTTTWHQRAPYNNLCPMGDGDRCVVGCVATAAAQIAYYHKWPVNGDGSHSYSWHGDNSCGGSTPGQVLTADFSDEYAYDDSPAAVAEISYEMGVAFDMDYGACGSGAYTMAGAEIFPTYFRYDDTARVVYREDHSEYSWFSLIKEDINRGYPILYRIYSHAIVCDGWRVSGLLNQYHFNYGWGGNQNAWYFIDNLHCPWSGCDPMVEAMVIEIIPLKGLPWVVDNSFDDNLGDGDGALEGGETVELVVTVANYGGNDMTDINFNLSIDDASLTITDGSAFLGTMATNDSVSNISDPFLFDIPIDYLPRMDSFIIEITWNGGAGIDTVVVEKAIGGVSILLVDDDENGDRDSYYREALDDFRIPYDVYEDAAYSTPDSAYLSDYDIVIWFTGDYRLYPISITEIESLRAFMNQGGKLFFTGQGVAAELNGLDPAFLNDYLKSAYQTTNPLPILYSQSGQVFDTGYTISIQGGNSASNQTDPDLIDPVNGGVAEWKYIASDYFGGVSYSGDYQLVFFSFGFESIVSDDPRWRGRDSIMHDILRSFGYQNPNACPLALDINVTPGDPMHLLDHWPVISWSYFDNEAAPQTMYQVQVGSDNNWLSAEMWDSGPIAGAETQLPYAGLELLDGETYYIRVRVYDGTLWSGWAGRQMRLNSVPPPATDLTPANMEGATSATPDLSHSNSDDGENDNLTYDYEIYTDPMMSVLWDHAEDIPQGVSTSFWTVTVPLHDDSVYYWRVRGKDPYEIGPWTDLAAFWVNSVNFAPDIFDLLSPDDEAKLPDRSPVFIWSTATDIDPFDEIVYTLYYSAHSDFSIYTQVTGLTDTAHSVPNPLEYGTTYYWKIKARDLFYGETYSDTFSFTTISRGDANGDGQINVADAIFIIIYIFRGGPAPDPITAGDPNCDSNCTVADAVFLVNFIFKGGPPPGCP